MRENGLQAATRTGRPRWPRNHDGKIIPDTIDTMSGADMTAAIVRETMFQSSPKENGITGWMFRTDGVPSSAGPLPSRG